MTGATGRDSGAAKSAPRDDMLRKCTTALGDPDGTLLGIDPILQREGYSKEGVLSAFGSIDNLLIMIAERQAALLSKPLIEREELADIEIVRRVLTDFGTLAWRQYSTALIGFVRLMMAEGARNPDLRRQVYEAGPALVALELRKFFSDAHDAGVLTVSDTHLAAEQLIGILREPLYQGLILHPAPQSYSAELAPVAASIDFILDGCIRDRAS